VSAPSAPPSREADHRSLGTVKILTLFGVLLVLAAAFWFRGESRRGVGTESSSRPPEAQAAGAGAPAGIEPTAVGTASEGAIPIEAMVPGAARSEESRRSPAPGRSPLERSPGYVPPADPESASVRLGRREAPLLGGEFDGGAASLEELCRLIVGAIDAGDEGALHAMRVNRAEFEKYLWREFPQSRPITNITADDAWGLSHATSLAGASRAVGQYGGRRLRYVRVEHGETQRFTNFDLVRGVEILAEGERTKELFSLRLVPSVAVRHGRYKALLYRD
jgi:hypothetical protein